MRRILLLTIFVLNCALIISQSCLPGGITFSSQAQIDAFQTNYPGCIHILGRLDIDESSSGNILNLNGLSTLTSISNRLVINDNDALTDLTGLNNLVSVGSFVRIEYNDNLTSLTGLNALGYIGSYLQVNFNNNMESVDGLNSLSAIGGDLRLEIDPVLTDLTALNSLNSIGGVLQINANGLTSLSGLENIDPQTISELVIVNSGQLSFCEVQSICDYLTIPGKPATIYGNATNCASRTAVENACTALPVELTSFTGTAISRSVRLDWKTASESRSNFFEIEHSRDGISFEVIGMIKAVGNSLGANAYKFDHLNLLPCVHHYRLKQVDVDGKFTYSNIISVKTDEIVGINILPNPTSNQLEIIVPDYGYSQELQLVDNMGHVLKTLHWEGEKTSLDLSVLPIGTYVISMNIDGQPYHRRIIKQ